MNYLNYPPILQWEITPFCNHDCIHCYNYWRSEDTKKNDLQFNSEVSEEYYLKIAKRIVESKPVIVTITGGEPMSVFSKIKSSIDLFLKKNIYVTINTNASLITDEIAQYLVDNQIPLFVSLPSSNSTICNKIINVEDGFKKIEEHLKMLISKGVSIRINMVVSKLNINTLYETAKYVKKELGLNYFCATKASLPINAKDVFGKYLLGKDDFIYLLNTLDKIKLDFNMEIDSSSVYPFCGIPESAFSNFAFKRRCNAGRVSFALTSTGDIKACARDSKNYGNILTNEFSECIRKMKSWQNGDYIPEDCKKCKHLWLCGGGCRIDSETVNGSICSLDPLVNLNNSHRDFTSETDSSCIDEGMKLSMNTDTVCVEEEKCYRISYKRKFMFLSKPFTHFIIEHNVFTPNEISEMFDVSLDDVLITCSSLIKKGLIRKL